MCFASPFSTPSNALVVSARRYTFMDYVKVGLPLQILYGIVVIVVLPLLWTFKTDTLLSYLACCIVHNKFDITFSIGVCALYGGH